MLSYTRPLFDSTRINTNTNIFRSAYDLLVKTMARNVAAVSSGFENLSTQVEASLTSTKVEEVASTFRPAALPSSTGTSRAPSSALASTLPALLPQLDRDMYKSVVHWDEGKYQEIRKGGKGNGEDDLKKELKGSVLSCYMEDENGNEVPENTRKAVRKRAKGLFNQLLQGGVAPATWGGAPLDVQHQLIFQLESEFPFLRFCANHWKSTMVATNSYSQWYRLACGRRAAAGAKGKAKDVSGHSNPSYQACVSVPNTSKSNLPLPVGCPYSRRSSRFT